jgi:hypothetical protein
MTDSLFIALKPGTADNAALLNRHCHCTTLNVDALRHDLEGAAGDAALYRRLLAERPHLFSASPVFVSRVHVAHMARVIDAIEAVVELPAYREHVLTWAPPIAAIDTGTLGVFLGYDFHLTASGPQLIEINTNAGGALLNTMLARAQQACCSDTGQVAGVAAPEQAFFAMFVREWRRARGDAPLARIAIVDDTPAAQYLHPEFLLFQRLFRAHGVDALIADPAELTLRDGALWHGEHRIDLVYNRLTDFSLQEDAHAVLREAYTDGAAVVTPHPRAHALYADKRNLAALTDADLLRGWGVPAARIDLLGAHIPRTRRVEASERATLWVNRRQLFFKPATGYGSKAAYRGDKLTKRVFEDILAGEYVAQTLVPPSERYLQLGASDGQPVSLKVDLRNYVYDREVQLLAARLYQGQVTNFRTAGGGFAPVFCPPTEAELDVQMRSV